MQDRIIRTSAGIVLGAVGLVSGTWWLAVVGAIFGAGGWWDLLRRTPSATAERGVDEIDATELYLMMQTEQPPVIFDVRTQRERSGGYVPESLHADINTTAFSTTMAQLSREDRYVIYCASGKRSALAVRTMRQLGFSDVQHVRGGYKRWRADGFPTT